MSAKNYPENSDFFFIYRFNLSTGFTNRFEAFYTFNLISIICIFELNFKTMVIFNLQYMIQIQYFIIAVYWM